MTTLTGIRATARFGDTREAVNPAAVEGSHEKPYEQRGKESYIWGALRFGTGWIFIWSFLDKLFGLGFPTSPESAWIAGGSPTFGFLNFGTSGPLADFYQGMAGNVVADTLYMIGMLAIGLPLLLGVGVRVAASIGVVMMGLIYTAGFLPPEQQSARESNMRRLLNERNLTGFAIVTSLFFVVNATGLVLVSRAERFRTTWAEQNCTTPAVWILVVVANC